MIHASLATRKLSFSCYLDELSAFRRSDLITFNTAGRIVPESRAILKLSILSLLFADQPGVVLAGNARALVWWDWSLHYVGSLSCSASRLNFG
jgi:hypothetical protein